MTLYQHRAENYIQSNFADRESNYFLKKKQYDPIQSLVATLILIFQLGLKKQFRTSSFLKQNGIGTFYLVSIENYTVRVRMKMKILLHWKEATEIKIQHHSNEIYLIKSYLLEKLHTCRNGKTRQSFKLHWLSFNLEGKFQVTFDLC